MMLDICFITKLGVDVSKWGELERRKDNPDLNLLKEI